MTVSAIKRILEHCPPAKETIPSLRGFWHKDESGDVFICARCSDRLYQRRVSISPAEPVYKDEAKPYGECAGCETELELS